MLRLLTSLPGGKLRFTVIDPVGLGQEFSAFMHLADFDELIIGTKIWTEKPQIEKRLTDLSEHMENVFQAYLRNEFDTIEEYNEQAGEVAEPYQFLVVANFPANFSDSAAQRLVSIVNSGPRCGVYTIISVDTKQPLPHNFDLADLEAAAMTLDWQQGRFVSRDPELAPYPVKMVSPPRAAEFTEIVKTAGAAIEGCPPGRGRVRPHRAPQRRVMAAGQPHGTRRPPGPRGRHQAAAPEAGAGHFAARHDRGQNGLRQVVAAAHADRQSRAALQSRRGAVLPRRLQERGRVQDVRQPRSAPCADHRHRKRSRVRHQRAGAIGRHPERAGRGFPRCGAQDVQSYRRARPNERMPRLLLVVDEFQEFFVEDDALSAAANLLLDRLVRQGRAFGIHVLLGSQTLGGAYSLARSTLGQVAVRIALQCSESDAHLILSEENAAARLLTRPGEAIYNDSNGLLEGNHPFQIAWLPDDRRDDFLSQVQDITRAQGVVVSSRPSCSRETSPPIRRTMPDLTKTIEAFPCDGERGRRPPRGVAVGLAGRAGLDPAADADSSSTAAPATTC